MAGHSQSVKEILKSDVHDVNTEKPAEDQLLNTETAASFIQPFMPNKNALVWIRRDAELDPMIPFRLQGNEKLYRREDLINFAVRVLGVHPNRIQLTPNGAIERRFGVDRRFREEVRLRPGIERRMQGADRRQR